MIYILLLIEIALLFLLCSPYGFHIPSSLGLHYGHFLTIATIFTIVWISTLTLYCKKKAWKMLLLKMVITTAFVVYNFLPPPFYNHIDYQGFVGKNKDEIFRVIGEKPKGMISSIYTDETGKFEKFSLNGMAIIVSKGKVISINEN